MCQHFSGQRRSQAQGPNDLGREVIPPPLPPFTYPWEGKGSGCVPNSKLDDHAFLSIEAGAELLALVFYCCYNKLLQS